MAGETRPVSTYKLWESIASGSEHELLSESQAEDQGHNEWDAVDERTMDGRQFARMQRNSIGGAGSGQTKWATGGMSRYGPRQKGGRKNCPLKDENGRSLVDFRAVGTMKGFLTDNLKILPRRKSGLSAKSQRKLARAVKTARTMALLNPEPRPRFTVEEMLEIDRNLP